MRTCTRCKEEFKSDVATELCSKCLRDVILSMGDMNVPARVGIARPGELVILECKNEVTPEHMNRLVSLLSTVKQTTGIHFLILDKSVSLARVLEGLKTS